jgi:hypothetical protein
MFGTYAPTSYMQMLMGEVVRIPDDVEVAKCGYREDTVVFTPAQKAEVARKMRFLRIPSGMVLLVPPDMRRMLDFLGQRATSDWLGSTSDVADSKPKWEQLLAFCRTTHLPFAKNLRLLRYNEDGTTVCFARTRTCEQPRVRLTTPAAERRPPRSPGRPCKRRRLSPFVM